MPKITLFIPVLLFINIYFFKRSIDLCTKKKKLFLIFYYRLKYSSFKLFSLDGTSKHYLKLDFLCHNLSPMPSEEKKKSCPLLSKVVSKEDLK